MCIRDRHNAVWCRLLGIHPIVQAKQVMSCMNVVTANLIIYQIGKRLFDGNRTVSYTHLKHLPVKIILTGR